MREIEFRIYDKQEKKFLIKNQKVKNGDIKNILAEIIDLEDYSIQINNPYEDRYEFLQYTGFKDKNGTKVYEGDILKLRDNHGNKVVKYNNEWGAFIDETSTGVLGLYYDDKEDFEIIGNMYENPELLREGE